MNNLALLSSNNILIGGKKRKSSKKYKGLEENNDEIKYVKNVSEPWFSLISLGHKSVEGRLNKGDFEKMKIGEIIKWTNNDFQSREILTKIVGKNVYTNFKEYLETEGIENCLPTFKNIYDGVNVYYKYYKQSDEKEFGVVAIKLKVID